MNLIKLNLKVWRIAQMDLPTSTPRIRSGPIRLLNSTRAQKALGMPTITFSLPFLDRPKRLSDAPSLSTIFTQLDFPPHPLRPPPPFCDSPYKPSYPSSAMTMRSSCHSDVTLKTPCPFDVSTLRSWRDHMQESPCLQRPPAPPPPPPPVRSSIYYGSSNSCYP